MGLDGVTGRALGIAGGMIGALVVISVIAAVIGPYLTGVADVNTVLNDPNTTAGDATADSLLPIFPLLVGITGLFAVVGAILAGMHFTRGSD